jgi:hypothetical protein
MIAQDAILKIRRREVERQIDGDDDGGGRRADRNDVQPNDARYDGFEARNQDSTALMRYPTPRIV